MRFCTRLFLLPEVSSLLWIEALVQNEQRMKTGLMDRQTSIVSGHVWNKRQQHRGFFFSWDQQHMETKSQDWSLYSNWQPVFCLSVYWISLWCLFVCYLFSSLHLFLLLACIHLLFLHAIFCIILFTQYYFLTDLLLLYVTCTSEVRRTHINQFFFWVWKTTIFLHRA